MRKFDNYGALLIWPAYIVSDWNEKDKDKFTFSEINNFSGRLVSHLKQGIQDKITDRMIQLRTKKKI